MQSEPNAVPQSDPIPTLEDLLNTLLFRRERVLVELDQLKDLITTYQSEPSKLEDLLKTLLSRRERLLVELNQLNALITTYQNESSKEELKSTSHLKQIETKEPRVRGVLAAARKAIDRLPGPFDKKQLVEKLVEVDEEFAHKKITGANIRNALRLLMREGVIKVETEATATTCAKYIKAA